MTLTDIQHLFAYNRWANQRLFNALAKISHEQYTRQLGGSFGSIHATLYHFLGAEWLWLQRWQGTSPKSMGSAADMTNFAEVRAFGEQTEADRQRYLAGLTERRLAESIRYTSLEGKPYELPLAMLMQHTVNHSTYHRGQVTTLLRQAGGEGVSLDLVYFYLEQKAQGAAK